MIIKTTCRNNLNVLEIMNNRIDSSSAVDFKNQLKSIIDTGNYQLVLDLGHVDFIDSSGIGAIVGVFKYLGQKGTFAIVGMSQTVDRVFRLTRMDKVFSIYSTFEEMIATAIPEQADQLHFQTNAGKQREVING